MRRPLTLAEWCLYILAACVVLVATGLICLMIIKYSAAINDALMLQGELDRYQAAEPPTGGAEVPIPEFVAGPDWRFPIADSDYRVLTSPFGYRVSPLLDIEMYHTGMDVAAAWKAQVVAVADGVVVEHWPPPDEYWRGHDIHGGYIVIEHAGGMRTGYSHLSWSRVNTGSRVRAGEVIGRVGNTGKSDGAHLHLEVIAPDGERLNPALYVATP